MKSKLIILILMIFCACTSQMPEKTSGAGDIIKLSKKESLSKIVLMFERSKGFKIYDTPTGELIKTHYYKIYMNKENKSQYKDLIFVSPFQFDKYSFDWVNDTTLTFRIFSSSSNLSSSFEYRKVNKGFTFSNKKNYSLDGEFFGTMNN